MVCRLHGLVEQACFHSNTGWENWVCGWTEGKIPSSPYTVTHMEGKVIKAGLWVLKKGMCVSVCVGGYVYAYMFLCVGVGTKVQVHGEARAPMYAIFLMFFSDRVSHWSRRSSTYPGQGLLPLPARDTQLSSSPRAVQVGGLESWGQSGLHRESLPH